MNECSDDVFGCIRTSQCTFVQTVIIGPCQTCRGDPAAKNQAAKTHGVKDHPLAPAVRIAGSPGFAPTHQPSKSEHGCSKRGHEWGKTAARACP